MLLLISLSFLLLYAFLIFYYFRAWRSFPDFEALENSVPAFISVVIAARNEEKNIRSLLDAMASQTYPKDFFEVIVVDDYSTDSTADIVKKNSLSNLHLIQPTVASSLSSKKKAIGSGIQKARGELIVTTDADCIPGPNWLAVINSFYRERSAIFIAAPVKFTHDGSVLQLFQALDFMTLQGITAASVATGFHSMCNGANLAYQKQAFTDVNGFEGIDRVATGDDMLLMHKIRKKHPTSVFYLKNQEAIISTTPMLSWKDFLMQRKRWASKTLVYDDYRIIAVLGFIYLLNCLFVVLIAASFFNPFYWWYVIGFWIGKTLIEFPFVYSVARFYKEQKTTTLFFFFQPVHMIYTVVIGLWSQMGRYEWKGRKTK
jgi:cellulose synthase/poly-beta-1,6-N-acetylglucosamine synthase-like glycosyltransferase